MSRGLPFDEAKVPSVPAGLKKGIGGEGWVGEDKKLREVVGPEDVAIRYGGVEGGECKYMGR